MKNLGRANNEVINWSSPLPSDLLWEQEGMGTIDFLLGPGCCVDVVCRLPTMCINTDVPRFTNGILQKAHGGRRSLFVSSGHLMGLLRNSVDEKTLSSSR